MADAGEATSTASKIILVTGGAGLVGRAIEHVVKQQNGCSLSTGNETWYFASTKDGNLA